MRITIDIEPSPKKSVISEVAELSPLLMMLWNMLRTSPTSDAPPPDIDGCICYAPPGCPHTASCPKRPAEEPAPNPPTSGAV